MKTMKANASHTGRQADRRRLLSVAAAGAALAATGLGASRSASAQKKYGPGVSDTEIRIGQTIPYSGAASVFGVAGRIQAAYVKQVNAAGGVNGRKINLISLDDGFVPPKAVEMTRRLVEQDEVFAMMGSVGTPTNVAVSKYLNDRKVPQLVVASGSAKLEDAAALPWTATFYPSQTLEGEIYAKYLLKNRPNARIAVLYQSDDYGKGILEGFRRGLGPRAAQMIIKEASYELTDPTVDPQIISLQASGADTFFHATTPKFAAQAIRKAHEMGWKPLQLMISNSASVSATLKPAGLEASKGVITSITMKFPGDPAWANDKGMQDYYAFVRQWAPSEDPNESIGAFGYSQAMMIVELLRRCGDELTRENLMKQASSIRDLQLPLVVPGVHINTTPANRIPFKQARLGRFDGTNWVLFGDVIDVREAQ